MGSQTLEILRQGVWASLTGGWFYDPHQSVFCNVVHLYIWLFFLCSPFVAYLYFPANWFTWSTYCATSSLIMLTLKLANMALHHLYDQAQTLSEDNSKHHFFKVIKEFDGTAVAAVASAVSTAGQRENERGIELKVMRDNVLSSSLDQAINELSGENSIASIDNVNSIIDLKVDVHRKNSSESIELMLYAPSIISGSSQNEQHSLAGVNSAVNNNRGNMKLQRRASLNRSLTNDNSNHTNPSVANTAKCSSAYLQEYRDKDSSCKQQTDGANPINPVGHSVQIPSALYLASRPPHLIRKSSDVIRAGHFRKRLERQSSLDATFEYSTAIKSGHNSSDTMNAVVPCENRLPTFASTSNSTANTSSPNSYTSNAQNHQQLKRQRFVATTSTAEISTTTNASKPMRLSRRRCSQSPDENSSKIQQQARNLVTNHSTPEANPLHQTHAEPGAQPQLMPHRHSHGANHHRYYHHTHRRGSSQQLAPSVSGGSSFDVDYLELGTRSTNCHHSKDDKNKTYQSWILGSSSDVFIEDNSCAKSDLGIEKLNDYPHQGNTHNPQQYCLHNPSYSQKDSVGTMSALQLSVEDNSSSATHANSKKFTTSKNGLSTADSGDGAESGNGNYVARANTTKHRRHSNTTVLLKCPMDTGSSNVICHSAFNSSYTNSTVRRIKSAALEIACPRPSISNLCPHPNSVEAITGQQQIKNLQNVLLPPPSKCLVRNPHLNLCSKFGGSFGGSSTTSSCDFGSTNALIDPVSPVQEHQEQEDKSSQFPTAKMSPLKTTSKDDENRQAEAKPDSADISDDDYEVNPLGAIGGGIETRRHFRHNLQHRHLRHLFSNQSGEADVGEFLNDKMDGNFEGVGIAGDADADNDDIEDDEFKDFDYNVEHVLQDLQHTQNQLDADLKSNQQEVAAIVQQQFSENAGDAERSRVLRERLHSTDSETDNNGSQSPLLSGKMWQETVNCSIESANESKLSLKYSHSSFNGPYACAKQSHAREDEPSPHCPTSNLENGGTVRLNDADSGCPSSDCEQISSSSKDMLLSGMDGSIKRMEEKTTVEESNSTVETINENISDNAKDNRDSRLKELTLKPAKNLGAIPKGTHRGTVATTEVKQCETSSSRQQIHKRHAGNWTDVAPATSANVTTNATTKAISRTSSSSNSSNSVSTDSFNATIQKMMWLMHDQENSAGCNNSPFNTPSVSGAHLQSYQDAIKVLQSTSPVDKLALADRLYYRDLLRRLVKQYEAESSQSSVLDVALNSPTDSATVSTVSKPTGVVLGAVSEAATSPRSIPNQCNVSNATTISLQGFFHDIISDELRAIASSPGLGSTSLVGNTSRHVTASATTAVLNVDNHQIENYCDYWRPTCMLSSEKASAPPKSFYKYSFNCLGCTRDFKISMDRLELLALFDRDLHWLHIVLSVILSALVAYFGACILQHNYYKDIFAFLFCAIIASSQYSLLKSVQPDAASPIHGFNKTVAYSRAIYFCICGGLLLLLKNLYDMYEMDRVQAESLKPYTLFGFNFLPTQVLDVALEGLYLVLLFFPLIFSLGLFPQISTFCMYLMEQIDMHIFGGNAAGSLLGSCLCILRSMWGIGILYGPLYASLDDMKTSQNVLFSIFCALLIPTGYHLSRSASDFTSLWTIVKNCIMNTYNDDDELSTATNNTVAEKFSKNDKNSIKDKCVYTAAELTAATTRQDAVENIEMSALEKTGEQNIDVNAEISSRKGKLRTQLHNSKQTLTTSKKTITASSSSMGGSNTDKSEGKLKLNDEETVTTTDVGDKLSFNSTTNPVELISFCGRLNENDGGDNDAFIKQHGEHEDGNNDLDSPDPLPKKLQQTVNTRLKNDAVVSGFLALVVFSLHCSTVFTVLQPDLNVILYSFTGSFGFLLHYIIPQMRKHMPWLCFARPILKQKEYGRYEVSHAPKVMWFEKFYIYMCLLERNVLFPLLVVSTLTADAVTVTHKYGLAWGSLIIIICGLKLIRNAYSDPTNQYLIVMFSVLLFRNDFVMASETFLIDYFFVSLAFRKCCDFLLKLQFILTYIAPWQITWGSAFHAFAQPFSVPHSAMLFLQAAVSALLSTPLNPFLGSAIFLTSYARPIKFWERDYNTRRIDHSNTRLSSQLERDLGADDNNLNSIFYEHLTRSLQHSLCGDLLMGRWGNVNQGDCFVLASDYLNCLVHIIELGNGLCTFQIRGLEFRGTYCQQREVEAITEDVEDNDGCCCCDPGHLPRMLSVNAMFSTRWLAWQVVASQYVVEGYSISDNLANATLQVFEYRKVLITYYLKSIIYYVIKNSKLDEWLASPAIQDALQHTQTRQFVDLDPIFNFNLDEDFDFRAVGITRSSFCYVYLNWINYCFDKRQESQKTQLQNNPSKPSTIPNTIKKQCSTASAVGSITAASTPNLSSTQAKSLSQQQLRLKPQKSTTMSCSGESAVAVNSAEDMATSYSLANISRQASESVPGLSSTPLSRSTKSAPVGSKHQRYREDVSASPQPGGRNGSTESSRGSEKPAQIKLKTPTITKDHPVVSLCLSLGLLARRSLATASHSSLTGVEYFLHGLHTLFKGDFRITSPRDEWVFADMDLLHAVVAPAVKMALKLQQDHISNPDEFRDPAVLYETIGLCAKDLVISHEADPVWRSAVLKGAPNLLALRHVLEDGSDAYRIIRLTKRFLTFRVIKLNRECVRGLWAGQQQELIYLRNRNPERGSIQNAKQALRNIINSSCDQPIGYPIYVSPLTTSYADTNEQLKQVVGGPITPEAIKANILSWWHHLREKCRQGCSSGSAMETAHLGLPSSIGGSNLDESSDLRSAYSMPPLVYNSLTANSMLGRNTAAFGATVFPLSSQFGSDGFTTLRSNLTTIPLKPNSTTLLAGFLNRDQEFLRETRTPNKGHSSASNCRTSERERRATLPITNTSSTSTVGADQKTKENSTQIYDKGASNDNMMLMPVSVASNSSPVYSRTFSTSGSFGINSIITTPGEYPRKTKGPICLTTSSTGMVSSETLQQTTFDLLEKVYITDDHEIYDTLDENRAIVWPYESMRLKGGRAGWKGWQPHVGMIGYIVHIWKPNHPDDVCRSVINRNLYLVEIGEYYVPTTHNSIKLYKHPIDKNQKDHERLLHNSCQRDMAELRLLHQHLHQTEKVLTPILGSLESPTSLLATDLTDKPLKSDVEQYTDLMTNLLTIGKSGCAAKIQAVSSSSSEDENELLRLEKQRRENFLSIWKHITDKPMNSDQQQIVDEKQIPEKKLTHTPESQDEFHLPNADCNQNGKGDETQTNLPSTMEICTKETNLGFSNARNESSPTNSSQLGECRDKFVREVSLQLNEQQSNEAPNTEAKEPMETNTNTLPSNDSNVEVVMNTNEDSIIPSSDSWIVDLNTYTEV